MDIELLTTHGEQHLEFACPWWVAFGVYLLMVSGVKKVTFCPGDSIFEAVVYILLENGKGACVMLSN